MKKQELKQLVKECIKILKETEMYDPESDSFSVGPRDRLDQGGDSLGIPDYPNAVIRPVDFDNNPQFFVYSDNTKNALILANAKTREDAIYNAKVLSKYIKQGGVGHTGELK